MAFANRPFCEKQRELLGFFFFDFFLRVAFFAGFSVFLGFNAARMRAVFVGCLGFFAAGFFGNRFAFRHGGASNERECADRDRQQFDEFHIYLLSRLIPSCFNPAFHFPNGDTARDGLTGLKWKNTYITPGNLSIAVSGRTKCSRGDWSAEKISSSSDSTDLPSLSACIVWHCFG